MDLLIVIAPSGKPASYDKRIRSLAAPARHDIIAGSIPG